MKKMGDARRKLRKIPKDKRIPGVVSRVFNILYEWALARKAQRILQKQIWATEYLSYLVARTTRATGKNTSVVLERKDGAKIIIKDCSTFKDPDPIMQRLDDRIIYGGDDE